jgi:outer membrane protein OmpA-like peptidoglycan-associated protein
MLVMKMRAQPSRHHGRLQAVGAAVSAWAALASLGLLSGCASMNPVNWFHSAEGGTIAKPHEAPPGQNAPYPNLATVPPTPPAPDMAALQHITDALIADRTNAQHLAAAAPLADPSSPTASPDLFGIGTTPPPGPPPPAGAPGASASLPAATAPPAPATPSAPPAPAAASPVPPTAPQRVAAAPPPPQKAPVSAVQSAPLPDVATVTQVPPAAVSPQPPVPTAPPPPPALPGVSAPPAPPPPAANAAVKAPSAAVSPGLPAVKTAASAAPRAVVSQPAANPATTVLIQFSPASSSVPSDSLPALKALAAKRGNHVIEALGRGDASSSDPASQQQAVTLGFARAQAIAAALAASGVPRGAIQVMALAAGSGGMAQLVE